VPWSKRIRSTVTPSRVEVDIDAVPVLGEGGWRLCTVEEVPLIGSVPKDYVAFGDPFAPGTLGYIAKRSKRRDIECVTEEIISSIGHMLPLDIATSRLVRLPGNSTAPDIRFMSRNFLRRGEQQLIHGIELVANFLGSRPDVVQSVFNLDNPKEERSFYTVEMVLSVLRAWGRTAPERKALCDSFGKMLAFDALIGAPDRHAMNWGGIEGVKDPEAPRSFAPIFDTARGLFCEHAEEKLEDLDRTGKHQQYIQNYAERSKPVFGCQCAGGTAFNHFSLIEHCLATQDEIPSSISKVIRAVNLSPFERALRRKFGRIITRRRMGYILDLLAVRSERLTALVARYPA
jgi:hypothetical protein